MTVILPFEENFAILKQATRSNIPDAQSSHITESIAYACGYKTHAALLADVKATGAQRLVRIDKNRFGERLVELEPHCANPCKALDFPRSGQFPRPIWRATNYQEKEIRNNWFNQCRQNEIPFVNVIIGRKYAKVAWDCVSLDPKHDDAINGKNSRNLLDKMYNRFQVLANSKKAFFHGTAFVGSIVLLPPEAAFKISDKIFVLLYSTINLPSPAQ